MTTATVGRNDPCWCGSGKKYKKCHWREDQRAVAERAAKEQARQARLEALGRPSDSEMRERYSKLIGQAPPPGPLPTEAREVIVEMWQQEQLANEALETLEPEREKWEEYFATHPDEFDEVVSEIGQDRYFDRFELTTQNQQKVRSELGPLPDESDREALSEYATQAIALSLDESDRQFIYNSLRARLAELVEEGKLKEAYVVETSAQRAQDPDAPITPFLRDIVVRSLRPRARESTPVS